LFLLCVLSVLAAPLFSSSHAQAAITPIPFSWCWKYTSQDGFETNTAQDWWIWGSANSGVAEIKTSNAGSVRSGTGGLFLSFGTSEPNGSYLIADRYIDRNLLVKTQTLKPGCTVPKPTASTRLRYCSASIWVRPSAQKGVNGSFQLLSTNYFYLAVQDFDFPASSTGQWQQVTIANTYACQDAMIIRVGINRTSSSIASVMDDVEIVWAY
jgi:hypothetical protein